MINIENAKNERGVIRQLGKEGKFAGSSVGFRKRDHKSKEAYLARRYILWRLEQGDLEYPFSMIQTESPDFHVNEGNDDFGLEITEASDKKSGRVYSDPHLMLMSEALGEPVGGQVVSYVIEHICDALRRKSSKNYAGLNTDLIIYPNSPARMTIGLFGNEENKWNELVLNEAYDVSGFRNVYLFWYENNCRFEKL